ncbi:MAG: B12-binding domain-containing radical SAM protein [Firmicutes bacterium]|nr:B12-binding domain-containing radical SAM protein [Bacillota bacterium]
MKKIVLIEPQIGQDHVYSLIKMPRLGLPLLGTQLKEAGYQVDLYTAKIDELPWHKIVKADLVGISLTTSTSLEGYRMADFLRSQQVTVVIGGIHPTFLPDEALQHADYVIKGEADFTFLELVRSLEKGESPHNIPGLSFRKQNNEVIHNPCPEEWVDINQTPMPDLSLFRIGEPRVVPIMTSRGCPFNCTFCSVTAMFGHQYRFRHTEKVLKELAMYQGRSVFFVDDHFTANKKRCKELLQGIIDHKISLKRWSAQVRVEAAKDDELLQLMQKSGGSIAFVGLESINPATLEAYNKKQSLDDIKECVRRFHDYKIRVHGMFVLGSDEDTIQTIRDTVDFSLDTRIDSVQFLTLTPLPGTPFFHKLDEEGRLLTKDWELYDGHHVVFLPAKMSPEELQEETVKVFKRFYSLRHVLQNVGLTGSHSALYRGVGWWLSRRFAKQSRWYDQALAFLKEGQKHGHVLSRKVQEIKEGMLELKANNNPLKIYINDQKGVIYLKIQGFLNRFNLHELNHTLRKMIPQHCFHLVVNTEELNFSSEKTARAFTRLLEKINRRTHRLQLIYREGENKLRLLQQQALKMPRFEILPVKK